LGYTFTPPERDKLQTTKSELLDEISVLLAGRATEQLVFSEQTAGASNDLERATKIARAMVSELGMSELGPMNFAPQYETGSYQKGLIEPVKVSSKLQEQVDGAVKSIIDTQLKSTTVLLKAHRAQLDTIAERLVEVETLDGDEFGKLMVQKKP
jgi:cell division protease FtsH